MGSLPSLWSGRDWKEHNVKYILNRDYRLRGWTDSIANLEFFPTRALTKITPRECLFLMQCDGKREADLQKFSAEADKFLKLDVIREAAGEELAPEQEYLLYENRFFRHIYLSLTGGCDFKCKHCFSAKDSNPRPITPKTEELIDLIRRLDECGVSDLWISGGEPLLHRGFFDITEEISKRGMTLGALVTNLYHMTHEKADRLLAQGHRPLIHTSFDGIGFHEWLRGVPGSEQVTLEKFRMMKEKGFEIQVHYCVWKESLPAVRDTVLALQETGVDTIRITCVEPAPRWVQGYLDQTISPAEWFDFTVDFLDWWYSNKINTAMGLDIWCFWFNEKNSNKVNIVPDLYEKMDKRYRIPICPDAYDRPYIDCDGRILTCIGMSGISSAMGMDWGNVYRDDLHELLHNSPFTRLVRRTMGELKDAEELCQTCEWNDRCGYGCRIEALAQGNGLDGRDERVCTFFREGYYDQYVGIAKRYGLS